MVTGDFVSTCREGRTQFLIRPLCLCRRRPHDASLTDVVAARKNTGPQDVKQALEAAHRKAERIVGFDDEALRRYC